MSVSQSVSQSCAGSREMKSSVVALLMLSVTCAFDIGVDNFLGFSEKYDPDVDLNTPDMIRRHGYPAEAHTVETADGFLLTLHRIPHGAGETNPGPGVRPVVFLQHGMVASSADWVISGPGKALAYLLADAGYDVWMGNARGNMYSRAHVSLSPADPAFWNFSWHEMGMLDLPAAIDHALTTSTRTSLTYVGHSMGTTMFYVLASSQPEYSKKIAAMFSLAPVAFMTHIKSPIRVIAPFAHDIQLLAQLLGENELMPHSKFLKFLARIGCEADVTEKKICENFLFSLYGFDAQQFNQSLLPVILGHSPAGTATKVLVHYAQLIQSNTFRQFDLGAEENQKVYGQPTPPDYQLSKVQVPVSLHFSDNDWLSNKTDVAVLADKLGKVIGRFEVPLASFNHFDFMMANDVKTLVYDNLMAIMHNYTHVQGDLTHVQGDLTHGQGDLTHVQGDLTHGQGDLTHVQGDLTHGQGDLTHVQGDLTHGQGDLTHGQGDLTHVQGDLTQQRGDLKHQMGDYSKAEDNNVYANDNHIHAQRNPPNVLPV